MKKVFRSTLVLLALAAPAFAASSMDFYLTLLRRGTSDLEAGRNADAVANLRLAAFGLLESIEHYEIAQAYLAVAFDRLGQQDRAREAAQRILAAEKVERKFRTIALPAAIRTAFDAVAKKVLSAADAAALSGGATAPAVVIDRVDVVTENRKPAEPAGGAAAAPAAGRPAPEAGAAPQTRPQNTQPAQPPAPKPQNTQPVVPKPKPEPARPQTQPRPQTTPPQNTQPARPQTTQPPPRTVDLSAQLAAGERALTSANINEARRIYRELLSLPNLEHGVLLRIAEGLYRSRDFANALAAFDRAGALRPGEEAYRFYIAVASYETGKHDRAKRELAAALPWIELTPDVQRYRVKIEGAR